MIDNKCISYEALQTTLGMYEDRHNFYKIMFETMVDIENAHGDEVYKIIGETLKILTGASCVMVFGAFDHSLALKFLSERTEVDNMRYYKLKQNVIPVTLEDLELLNTRASFSLADKELSAFRSKLSIMNEAFIQNYTGLSYMLNFSSATKFLGTAILLYEASNNLKYIDMVDLFVYLVSVMLARNIDKDNLKSSVLFMENLIETIPSPVYYKNAFGEYQGCNKLFADIFGISKGNVLGKTIFDLVGSDLAEVFAVSEEGLYSGNEKFECEVTMPYADGTMHNILIHSASYRMGDNERGIVGMLIDITQRKEYELQISEQGNKLRETNESLLTTIEDVNKAHEELKKAQLQLVHSEKLASIGQLSAGIAHEINNPLGYVKSNIVTSKKYFNKYIDFVDSCDELLDTSNNLEEFKQQFKDLVKTKKLNMIKENFTSVGEDIEDGLDRIRKIVLDLKLFARSDTADDIEPLDINEVFESVLSIVWNEVKYKAELVKDLSEVPKIKATAQKLGQVFINLIVNAAHAITEKGTITVRTYSEDNYVYAEVEDDGVGLADDIKENIFNPFFTTKAAGEGTGMGLSISSDIVQKLGGELYFDSDLGHGTKFIIKLPVAEIVE